MRDEQNQTPQDVCGEATLYLYIPLDHSKVLHFLAINLPFVNPVWSEWISVGRKGSLDNTIGFSNIYPLE